MAKLSSKNPLVYIILPCYNGEKYLLEQLMSLYYQNYNNWYLIFVNDGSTDNSEAIARDWISHYNLHDKVRVITKENGGVNSAISRGLEEVKKLCDIHNTDSLISYCDQDDIRTREKLAIQLEYMVNHPEYDLSFHDSAVIDENGILTYNSQGKTTYLSDLSFFYFGIVGNPIASNRLMFKAECIDIILPMAIGPSIFQDERTMFALSLNNAKFGFINKGLTYHRLGHLSLGKKVRDLGGIQYRINKQKIYHILQERFPKYDISYIINYNYDRFVKWNKKYGLISFRSYFLTLIKYPRAFFLLVKCVLYKVVNNIFG